jgi:ABC-type antimicrobial peptide transport system permease subunit
MAIADSVRRAITTIDPMTAIYDMRPMTEIRRESVSERRFLLTLVGVFGLFALILAAVGVYGVMAVVVSERTAEVGVRLALGAKPSQILALVLGQAGTLAAVGIGIGLVLAVAGAPLMAHSLSASRRGTSWRSRSHPRCCWSSRWWRQSFRRAAQCAWIRSSRCEANEVRRALARGYLPPMTSAATFLAAGRLV